MSAMTRCRVAFWGVVLGLGLLATPAAASGRGPGWVPKNAWRAVQKYARTNYDAQAKLFKTSLTKSQSLGLLGAHSGAWIVGAKATPSSTSPGFAPFQPKTAYFLVTKDGAHRWGVTPLAGMSGYLSKTDARAQDVGLSIPVGQFGPGNVGHGVEVSNVLGLQVTQGTALAAKRNGNTTHTVYVRGSTGGGGPFSNQATAKIKASVACQPGSRMGVPVQKDIPVRFSQVFFLARQPR